MLPVQFFFLKGDLTTQGLLWFQKNFRIGCSISRENVIGIVIRFALNL